MTNFSFVLQQLNQDFQWSKNAPHASASYLFSDVKQYHQVISQAGMFTLMDGILYMWNHGKCTRGGEWNPS